MTKNMGSFTKTTLIFYLERTMGIGPTPQPWEGRVLPLYYARCYCPDDELVATDKSSTVKCRVALGGMTGLLPVAP